MSGTGKYEPLAWQIVTDAAGFQSVHETDEDGGPGDLVCHVFGDHARLIEAAPTLLEALKLCVERVEVDDPFAKELVAKCHAAIAKATGAA